MRWVRYECGGEICFGVLGETAIARYRGELFGAHESAGMEDPLDSVRLLTPCEPSKMIALWNNFHASAAKQGIEVPGEPLYLLKPSSCFIGTETDIVRPAHYDGKVIYEGELGVVIGTQCRDVAEADATDVVFGYTCINDVTAFPLIHANSAFQQWTRSKSFDTFGVFGPCIAQGLDPDALVVQTRVNGDQRQDYPVADAVFSPLQLVSLLSHDMTLYPGDVIAIGTSIGAGSMRPDTEVEVTIEGIGTLHNWFDRQ